MEGDAGGGAEAEGDELDAALGGGEGFGLVDGVAE